MIEHFEPFGLTQVFALLGKERPVEERDLVRPRGGRYRQYRRRVAMPLPIRKSVDREKV